MRIWLAILAALGLAFPADWAMPHVMRAGLQFMDLVGIANPVGPTGGRVSGYYQLFPSWARSVNEFVAAFICYLPVIGIAAWIAESRPRKGKTICGSCRKKLVLKKDLRCAHCGVRL